MTVKGLDTPAEVYELIGGVAARSRLQAAAARGLTRFVGRERELEQLAQALDRAAAGDGQMVAIVGEPAWEVAAGLGVHAVRTARMAGSCSRVGPSPTARRRRICPPSSC